MPTIDFVIPLLNERGNIDTVHALLEGTRLPDGYHRRYILVDDGSTDGTREALEHLAAADPKVTVIGLSRNFGHQAALSAGLDAAGGDVVVTLDGDGQHPPSLVPDMVRLHEAGYDVVQAQRLDEPGSSGFLKRATSRLFYRLLNLVGEVNLVSGTSDFRLLSRRALDALRQLPEYHRFLRGMIVWMGFPSVVLPYRAPGRLSGRPKYSVRKMLRLASDGLFSFSLVPLRIGLFLGTAFIGLALVEIGFVATLWLGGRRDELVPGWSSLILILTVSSAITMILQGVLGIYIGMIFREVKRRPIYLIRSRIR